MPTLWWRELCAMPMTKRIDDLIRRAACVKTFRRSVLAKLYELDGRKAGEGFIEQAKTIVGQPQFQFRDTLGEGEKKEPFDEDSISHFALRLGLCIRFA